MSIAGERQLAGNDRMMNDKLAVAWAYLSVLSYIQA